MDGEEQVAGDTPRKSIDQEDRIDEFGISQFQSMGYVHGLSDNHIKIYQAYKRKKDRLQPGRLMAGELAFVATLADLADNKLLK